MWCGEEHERLEALLRKGKSPAQRMLKARILLKADVSEAGEGWSDSRIIKALETSASMVYRVRKQLAEEGFEAVFSRKQRAAPAVARIFDGEKEAKLIALACSKPPKGRPRWTLRLLEKEVVELHIVDRASDSTIGRALKKHSPAPSPTMLGHSARGQQRVRSRHGGRGWPFIRGHVTLIARTLVLVQDNLNIHSKASLYEAFPAAEARRLVERFEWHYTPKHGSWLDLAESELGVLSSQCLDRRIPDKQTLVEEIAACRVVAVWAAGLLPVQDDQ